MRKEVNSIVREFALVNGGNYEACYNRLYKEFNKKNHCYIKARAKNSKSKSVIEYIEKNYMLDSLLELAKKLYK